jgi:hypothetical protein
VIKEASSQEDWGMDFFLVTEEETDEVDWIVGFASVIDAVGLKDQGGGSWMDVILGLEV